MALSKQYVGKYMIISTTLLLTLVLYGCGGEQSSAPATSPPNSMVVSGQVPGTFIEAFGTNGSYYATESAGAMVDGFRQFSLTLPADVIYSVFMTVSENSSTQSITTPIMFRDSSSQLTPFFTGAKAAAIDLGQLNIYKTRSEAGGNQVNGVVVESQRPVLVASGAEIMSAGLQTTSGGLKLWDRDNDGVHNAYDHDYQQSDDSDKDGIPDFSDINPGNSRSGVSPPSTFIDSDGDGYLDGDSDHDGFLDSDQDYDGYADNQVEGSAGNGWQLAWFDEFSSSTIDTNKWSLETNCWGGGNNEQQCYTDRRANSFLEDGKLIIRAKKESFSGPAEPLDWNSAAGNKTLPYTSARLRTLNKGDWAYGRIEVRAKLPAGQGVWPAIWMLPSGSVYGQWAASGEIDIMEAINLSTSATNQQVHGTIHYGAQWPDSRHSGTAYTFSGTNPTQAFHTYAIEWGSGEIRWYVDNVLYATKLASTWYTNGGGGASAPFDKPFHLLLNVAVGGNWPGSPNLSTVMPVQMEVDFVRVYSCPATPTTLVDCTK